MSYYANQNPYSHGTLSAQIPDEDRHAAALAHASTLIAMVVSAGWLSFVGPLIIWMLYKDRSPYVRRAAAGAFNFNIWVTLASIIAWVLIITVIGAPIGIPLLAFTAIVQLFAHLNACFKALRGKHHDYMFQTRILN